MGVDSFPPLAAAIETIPCPTVAHSLLGRAVNVHVATCVLKAIEGMGHLPRQVRYASLCSGIDTFAVALATVRPGAFRYHYSAEMRSEARSVLEGAWGPAASYSLVSELEAVPDAELGVDLMVITPDCVRFSRRRHTATIEERAWDMQSGAADVEAVLGPVQRRVAAVVVIENVAEIDAIGVISTVLHTRMCGYKWYCQILSPLTHAGKPCERVRAFWVGVRQ